MNLTERLWIGFIIYTIKIGDIISVKKVSVIIPCHNIDNNIDKLMESLVEQSIGIENIDLIFVDDFSSDNTVKKLMAWESKFEKNIKIIKLDENVGAGAARNIGMQYVESEYISFIDGDDFVESEYFNCLLTIAEKYECDIVRCDYNRSSAKTDLQVSDILFDLYDMSNEVEKKKYIVSLYSETMVWNSIYKTDFIKDNNILFPEGIRFEDTYFTYMTMMTANRIAVTEEVLYHYQYNDDSIMSTLTEQQSRDRDIPLMMFLDECIYRGWLDKFKSEIEYLFIKKYYREMVVNMFNNFSDMNYYIYFGIKKVMKENFPNYCDNNYFKIIQKDTVLLLLNENFTQSQVQKIFEQYCSRHRKESNCYSKEVTRKNFPILEDYIEGKEMLYEEPDLDNMIITEKYRYMLDICYYNAFLEKMFIKKA